MIIEMSEMNTKNIKTVNHSMKDLNGKVVNNEQKLNEEAPKIDQFDDVILSKVEKNKS
jgi:hypothetical protein